jgi:hypothetical protein
VEPVLAVRVADSGALGATSGSKRCSTKVAVDAPINSYREQHEPTCLPNTRIDVLRDIRKWAEGVDERCIFWLNGLAGMGKSTTASTVARNHLEKKRLGASFFFSPSEKLSE